TAPSTPTSSNTRPRPGALPPASRIPAPDTPEERRRVLSYDADDDGASSRPAAEVPSAAAAAAASSKLAELREELARDYRRFNDFSDMAATSEAYMVSGFVSSTHHFPTTSAASLSSWAGSFPSTLTHSSLPSSSQMTSARRESWRRLCRRHDTLI
ncbi:hypothetical protein PMAYCL1PPCAC_00969, partial [Pristionchus mayeri]